ncbi:MAG: hypothetical protein AUI91_14940 [Acidobacteria bacterium 13_1_40CM_3_56_11]|nr:MAG: hypothetical protein AUI91_14940 [Acidobacteria bacterium 13_1_40CM_3_56_11]
MTRTLRTEGLLPPLFPVEGRLVEYYNRALKQVTGIETSLSSFTVDMRGKSPEIAEELGDDYLQVSDAHRFMIIVSPEQMDAGMLQSEFSIDSDAIRRHYDHFLSGISIVTRVDGLYSELQDFVRTYSNPGDVLGLRKLNIELHTPSGFISKALQQKEGVKQLRQNPRLLIENNSAHIHQLYPLFQEVGDVLDYNITQMNTTFEVGSFFSKLFGGVYVFRDREPRTSIKPKRPGTPVVPFRKTQSDKDCVIFHNGHVAKGKSFTHIPLGSIEAVVGFLLKRNYASLQPSLVEQRICRIEELTLLDCGFDVVRMSLEQRCIALNDCQKPALWQELTGVEKHLRRGNDFRNIAEHLTPSAQAALLVANEEKIVAPVTSALLHVLCPFRYEETFKSHPAIIETDLQTASPIRQDYIVDVLKKSKAAATRCEASEEASVREQEIRQGEPWQ